MKLDDARQLRKNLEACSEVNWAQVVMWSEEYGQFCPESSSEFDGESDRIDVEFHAYDSLVPGSVVSTIQDSRSDIGVYIAPDSFVTSS